MPRTLLSLLVRSGTAARNSTSGMIASVGVAASIAASSCGGGICRARSAVMITTEPRVLASANADSIASGSGTSVSMPVSRKPAALNSSPMKMALPMSARPVEDQHGDDEAIDGDAFGEADQDQHAAEQLRLFRQRADRSAADHRDRIAGGERGKAGGDCGGHHRPGRDGA